MCRSTQEKKCARESPAFVATNMYMMLTTQTVLTTHKISMHTCGLLRQQQVGEHHHTSHRLESRTVFQGHACLQSSKELLQHSLHDWTPEHIWPDTSTNESKVRRCLHCTKMFLQALYAEDCHSRCVIYQICMHARSPRSSGVIGNGSYLEDLSSANHVYGKACACILRSSQSTKARFCETILEWQGSKWVKLLYECMWNLWQNCSFVSTATMMILVVLQWSIAKIKQVYCKSKQVHCKKQA